MFNYFSKEKRNERKAERKLIRENHKLNKLLLKARCNRKHVLLEDKMGIPTFKRGKLNKLVEFRVRQDVMNGLEVNKEAINNRFNYHFNELVNDVEFMEKFMLTNDMDALLGFAMTGYVFNKLI